MKLATAEGEKTCKFYHHSRKTVQTKIQREKRVRNKTKYLRSVRQYKTIYDVCNWNLRRERGKE